jgi:DNA mismatch repair protein MutS2
VDVRGLYAEEATAELDRAIGAHRGGALFVVHGVGTGRLRAACLEHLGRCSAVLRVQQAEQRDGGAGCTLVVVR